ncbi:MAG: SelT/SelW/SelH family protein [Gemmatimonadetes bacterium]|nr:MAG: SelT/SelW/SelH family protein [Gemmatimonadota bacterium]
MAAELKQAFPDCDVQLLDSSGGVFEVEVDGTLVFSKKALGRHADSGEVLALVTDAVG